MKRQLVLVTSMLVASTGVMAQSNLSTSMLSTGSSSNVVDKLKMSADFRYRWDRTDVDERDVRDRNRIRARIGIKGKVQNAYKFEARLATGSEDPVSTNQSEGDSFSSKNIKLDRANVKYSFPNKITTVTAGKMSNPMDRPEKTELVWDGDLSPEGLSINHKGETLQLQAGAFWLEERKASGDTLLLSSQVATTQRIGNVSIKGLLGYYDFGMVKEKETLVDNSESFGNSTFSEGNTLFYENDFDLIDAQVVLSFKDTSFKVFGNYVRNVAADDENSGWLVGSSYGKDLKASYNFRVIESDAVIGAFTDSDFKGGGTDGRGHEFGLSYKLTSASKLSFSHFYNQTKENEGKDYHRSFIDFALKI